MQNLWKWLGIFITAWAVSFFLYPTSFTFFQIGNTKIYLAVLGLVFLTMQVLRYRTYSVDKHLINTLLIAGLYSVVNLIATDYNGFADYSYGNYITSALVWLFSAYSCSVLIKWVHGIVSVRLWVFYLAAVSALQCIIALLIDNFGAVKIVIHSIFSIEQEFFEEIGRLYGIGAALDPAGTRFAAVLIFIAYLLSHDEIVRRSQKTITWLVIAYIIIIAVGNIISRTTVTGAAFSGLILMLSYLGFTGRGNSNNQKLYKTFAVALILAVPLGVFLYNTSDYFYDQFRFAFEGFFSLAEKGYWETSSNNILATMWRWPETTEAWIIGYGEYDGFHFGTDIGYCRFILYSGIVGFSVFAFMFIYQLFAFSVKYPGQKLLFFLVVALSFVIWIKVSTDLFQFWAILHTFTAVDWLKTEVDEAMPEENNIITQNT